jgi:hypothetical protein
MKGLFVIIVLFILCVGCGPKPDPYANPIWIDPILLESYQNGWRATQETFYVDSCFASYKEEFEALDHVMDPLNATITFSWEKNFDVTVHRINCDFTPVEDWVGQSNVSREILIKMEWLEKEKDTQLIKHVFLHEIWHQFRVGHVPNDGMSLMSPIATPWNIITKPDLDAWSALYGL